MNEIDSRYYDGAFAVRNPDFAANELAEKQSMIDKAIANAKAVGTIAGNIAASAPAGVAGLAVAPFKGAEGASKTIESVQSGITDFLGLSPTDQSHIEALQTIGGALEKLGIPAKWVGDQVLEATGSPAAATAAELILDPLNIVGAAAPAAIKPAAKAAGRVAKQVADKVSPGGTAAVVGATALAGSEDAEALPLSRPIAQAIRQAIESSANITEAGVKKAIQDTGIKQERRKIDATAKRVVEINKELSGSKQNDSLWSGSLGTMRVGHPEMGGYHVMLEHPGDLIRILRAGGVSQEEATKMPLKQRLIKSLDIIESSSTKENADQVKVGDLRIKIVRDGKYIGSFYPE